MLELRPTCENCNKLLPYDSEDAMICTFECTFCTACVETILHHVCPNCSGNFSKRPIRPKHLLKEYPVSTQVIFNSVDIEAHRIKIKNLSK